MLFAHAPKLVLTGPYEALRPVADRAAALGSEVVLAGADLDLPVGDVAGFDWAIVAVDEASPSAPQLARAADVLATGLHRGALVVVASGRPIDPGVEVFSAELERRRGLSAGDAFAVVSCVADAVVWGSDAQAVDDASHLVARIGVPSV
ncbi:hypothetical protein [Frigoribacterium sp. PhB24]|uniref:hypothetical protein n=1 Tax=Frigoribacterium sp. PhB24 TaxID=2485204 RepID=UPI000F4AD439|nr:hypothetical protein [Frigoribacterium sp. PhB24]ROS47982.1 hypothetical protein EDF50_3114 [Frigoribacterium sp. PhB24]